MPPRPSAQQRCAAHLRAVQRIRQVTVALIAVITTLLAFLDTPKDPEPYHTSILSGQGWVDELLSGHPDHICCKLEVRREVFIELIAVLHSFGFGDSKYVQLEEQLAIFLYMCVTGLTIRHTGECFQRSNETILKYFCRMLGIFSSEPFYTTYVILPNADTPPSRRICRNKKMWPFFKCALGVLDGSHFACAPPLYSQPSHKNRKGFVSQNCLFACSFNLQFSFCYIGWEGSATDAQVWEAGLQEGLVIPDGYYYLADAGYPTSDYLLTPYCGVRYHLAKWSRSNQKYAAQSSYYLIHTNYFL